MNCSNCGQITDKLFCSTECKNAYTRKNAPEIWGIRK